MASKPEKSLESVDFYPVLPLKDVVVYPHMVIPLFVGREKSVRAIEESMATNQKILLIAQKSSEDDDLSSKNLYKVGTLSTILQLMKLPDGTLKILVEGEQRVSIKELVLDMPFIAGKISVIKSKVVAEEVSEAIRRALMYEFDQYVKLNKKVPPEAITSIGSTTDIGLITDTIIAHTTFKIEDRQILLELSDPVKRAEKLIELLQNEVQILDVEKSIRTRVKKQMDQNQKEYYLNEQMKAIQSELGDGEEGFNEIQQLEKEITESGMNEEATKKVLNELKKLKMMPASSAEATVVRNYIDTLLSVPWKKQSRIRKNIKQAEKVLDQDHYGLEKIKERILEYLAVQQRKRKLKGPILCLVGPPGVGKTSLGESIARATGRKFVRMALGGVRDEAEIRGHRRTYIGSMPGQIIQKMTKSGVKNPLFLLDEIDKMSTDFRGDPASAMLEVLDPEQNHSFNDHYLEVDYDLSDVMFVATANSLNIPSPLLDRMEIIHLSGYTEDEKLNISKKYLIPKKMENSGLRKSEIKIKDSAITEIIRSYTREAGVRSIDREIAKICRKVVKQILLSSDLKSLTISDKNLEEYLGVKKFRYGMAEEVGSIGQVTGLAWTQVGGELLTIEAASVPGKGKIIRTGKLGDVMQESIQAALTVVRGLTSKYNISKDFYEKNDLHVHVPEGATPKDGPSAGIAMCTVLVSVLTGTPVRHDVAMTGEITLRGEVLAIGGLKEKLLAALRGGIKTVLIPKENERDLKEIPDNVKNGLEIIPVKWVGEVLEIAFEK